MYQLTYKANHLEATRLYNKAYYQRNKEVLKAKRIATIPSSSQILERKCTLAKARLDKLESLRTLE